MQDGKALLGIHGCTALSLGHLLIQVSSNVFAAVHVRGDLKQPVRPDLCHCASILLACQHQLMVHNPPGRTLQSHSKLLLRRYNILAHDQHQSS